MADFENNPTETGQQPATVPPGYSQVHHFNMSSKRPLIWMNIIGVVLFLLALALIFWGLWFYEQLGAPLVIPALPPELPVGFYFIMLISTLILHELLHGLPIWLYGKKPRFGIKISKLVLFTTSDDFFTRQQYIVVILMPLLVISIGGVILMLLVAMNIALWIAIMVAMNFASAIGDMWMAAISTSFPREALFFDEEDGSRVFLPDDLLKETA